MKRLTALLLSGIMLLSLTACGNSNEQSQGETNGKPADNQVAENKQDDRVQEFLDNISAETAEAKGVCGADLTWYYQDNVLVIKGTGDMTDYPSDIAPWKDVQDDISWVIIEDGVTSIGKLALGFCGQLTKVVIPNSVVKIGDKAFFGCGQLKSITIPDGVTSIGSEAFRACTELESIIIPDNIEEVGSEAFRGVPHIEYHGTAKGAPWGAKSMN